MPRKLALYDLARMPTTFDFACFAVIAKTLGYEEVRFVVGQIADHKYPAEIAWRRWANICIPMCRLAGLKFSVSERLEGDELGYATGQVEAIYKRAGAIEKLKAVECGWTKQGYVTITMRQSFRNTWRNSDRAAWGEVEKWLAERGEEVLIVEECEFQPMALDKRMALYSNAKMNLAVGNGPMVLCWLSDAPYLSFQLPHREGREKEYDALVEQWNRMTFPVGSQLSWRTPKQEIVWGPDDFATVTKHYAQMFPTEEARQKCA